MRNTFGNSIATLRKASGYSQKELAEKLGINANTYIGYETAGREPKFATLIKIADFFGVSIDALIRGNIDNSDKVNSKRQALYDAILSLSDQNLRTVAELITLAAQLQQQANETGKSAQFTQLDLKIAPNAQNAKGD